MAFPALNRVLTDLDDLLSDEQSKSLNTTLPGPIPMEGIERRRV
jgi:hypothetical protein